MKAGIYIPGLGEAFLGTSVKGYAERLAYEMDMNHECSLARYTIKEEKLEYGLATKYSTTCITIYSSLNGVVKTEYKLYDLKYGDTITHDFNKKTVIGQCLSLLSTVARKSPILLGRLFKSNAEGYQSQRYRVLSFYTFLIFFIIALAGIIMIPAAIVLIEQVFNGSVINDHLKANPESAALLIQIKKWLLGFTSIVLVLFTLAPATQGMVTALAKEFSCVDKYLEMGTRSQAVMGQLNELIDQIDDWETSTLASRGDFSIHLHSYSFGSILALDLLYPFTAPPTLRVKTTISSLVTIGCPYEFIQSYYPKYFENRIISQLQLTHWINVHSKSDALSSNFRNDALETPAQYTICQGCLLPDNIGYNIGNSDPAGIWKFLSLYSLKAHQFYWQHTPGGTSCLGPVYLKMRERGHI